MFSLERSIIYTRVLRTNTMYVRGGRSAPRYKAASQQAPLRRKKKGKEEKEEKKESNEEERRKAKGERMKKREVKREG